MLLRLLNTFIVLKITTKSLNGLNAKFKHFSRILALQQARVSRLKTFIFKKLEMWKFHLNNSGLLKTTNFFLALLWEPTVWCTLWPSLMFSTFGYIFQFSTKFIISLEGNTPYFTLAEISLFHRERRCNTPYGTAPLISLRAERYSLFHFHSGYSLFHSGWREYLYFTVDEYSLVHSVGNAPYFL